ncbi:hypothetical protein D3C76_1409510 [compost metagenome]
MHHAQHAPPRVMPRPMGDGLAQADRHQQERCDVVHHWQVGLVGAPRQKTEHPHVDQCTGRDNDAQVGLVQFVILVKIHCKHPCAPVDIRAMCARKAAQATAKLA